MNKSGNKKRAFVDQLSSSHEDILAKRYVKPNLLNTAQELLREDELTEEAFLGAQGVLLINGML